MPPSKPPERAGVAACRAVGGDARGAGRPARILVPGPRREPEVADEGSEAVEEP